MTCVRSRGLRFASVLILALSGCASLNGWKNQEENQAVLDRQLQVGMTRQEAEAKVAALGASRPLLEADPKNGGSVLPGPFSVGWREGDSLFVLRATEIASMPPWPVVCEARVGLYFDKDDLLTHWLAWRGCMGP
jgi:hypothetical protein